MNEKTSMGIWRAATQLVQQVEQQDGSVERGEDGTWASRHHLTEELHNVRSSTQDGVQRLMGPVFFLLNLPASEGTQVRDSNVALRVVTPRVGRLLGSADGEPPLPSFSVRRFRV
jgi:hypothetical protein